MSQEQPDGEDLDFWSFIDYAIERTVRQLPEVDPLAMRLVFTLHRAANMIVYDLESSVHRPRGWSWAGFRVLFVIWLAGPLEAKRVAELSGMSRAAVSALVATLEREGLVTKRRDPRDRRAVLLGLTGHGTQAIAEAFQVHNAREQAWAATLDEDERATLISLLEKLTSHSVRIDARHRL
ncbi:MarR family winged helix-turn-helix transcriptional regulator [Nonomuraea lactucae]|uniref:MarR family winged helix-turn-helix transcriptional regulator n=1 Tax=Nonomuraea lactucae TaxID=2249762 RepID=UPI0013B44573|nr:MarR family transcriptional regulator [Nonomuraea lactucae]